MKGWVFAGSAACGILPQSELFLSKRVRPKQEDERRQLMKRRILISTILGMAFLGSLTLAEANVNQRQRRHEARIGRGAATGELTRAEYGRLQRAEARIQLREAQARYDGDFTRKERARINHQLNRQSRHIYRQKHDAQDRD
jgi:hypothetical protein